MVGSVGGESPQPGLNQTWIVAEAGTTNCYVSKDNLQSWQLVTLPVAVATTASRIRVTKNRAFLKGSGTYQLLYTSDGLNWNLFPQNVNDLPCAFSEPHNCTILFSATTSRLTCRTIEHEELGMAASTSDSITSSFAATVASSSGAVLTDMIGNPNSYTHCSVVGPAPAFLPNITFSTYKTAATRNFARGAAISAAIDDKILVARTQAHGGGVMSFIPPNTSSPSYITLPVSGEVSFMTSGNGIVVAIVNYTVCRSFNGGVSWENSGSVYDFLAPISTIHFNDSDGYFYVFVGGASIPAYRSKTFHPDDFQEYGISAPVVNANAATLLLTED